MAGETVSVSSRIAYENRWTRVREHQVLRPDGSPGLYGVVERADFAILVPWQDGRITLVEQFRFPVGRRLWELPMGMWEERPDIAPEALAAAELREETGLVAARLRHAGAVFQGAGYTTQRGHVFLATGLSQGETAREASEQDMVSRAFALAEVEAMIAQGVLLDAMSIAALALVRVRGWFDRPD